MSLDHGVLNVPLSKRGNIDREIDAYKADMARQAKADNKARREELATLRTKAKAAVAAADAEFLALAAWRNGTTVAAIKKVLQSDAHWRPAIVLRILGGAA